MDRPGSGALTPEAIVPRRRRRRACEASLQRYEQRLARALAG
jgi:hypothetical protein